MSIVQDIKPNIDILISTYNGAEYLREQLDSIINQSYLYWRIIIRDDGSTDTTCDIINEYLKVYPEKFGMLTDDSGNIGVCQSFARLIEFSDADYIMFADQDDVWRQDKINISIKKMIDSESGNGKSTPVLVHTDLCVVDDKLNCISKSFMKYQGLNGNRVHLNQLIVQNCITGCTVLFNRSLKDIILPIDSRARMHDWWIAIVASIFGKIIYINEQTVYYRQHSSNAIGAKKKYNLIMSLLKPAKLHELKQELYLTIDQAKSILEYNEKKLTAYQRNLLNGLFYIEGFNLLKKRLFLIKYRLFKNG